MEEIVNYVFNTDGLSAIVVFTMMFFYSFVLGYFISLVMSLLHKLSRA